MKTAKWIVCAALTSPALAQGPVIDVNLLASGGPPATNTTQAFSAGAPTGSDDFNRPDSTNMGPNWTERLGDMTILSDKGSSVVFQSWMTHNSVTFNHVDSVQTIDFHPQPTGTETVAVALVCGDPLVNANNILVKVQDNTGDGIYDSVFFYNGIAPQGAWGSSPYFFSLAVPTASGRMELSFSVDGDAAIAKIDRNFDGVWDEQFSTPGLIFSGLVIGTNYGISTFHDATYDNWTVNGGIVNTGSAYCFGDGSGANCPCSGFGIGGAGCANTASTGATLTGQGNAVLSGDTFQLDIVGVPGAKPGLVLRGANQLNGGLGNPVGDGLLCTGGQTARSHVQVTVAGNTSFTDFQGNPFGVSSYGAGIPTNYQFWYRDNQNTCSGSGFNFSNAWTVNWLP